MSGLKSFVLLSFLVLVNIPELLYQVSFKLDFKPAVSYIIVHGLSLIVVALYVRKVTLQKALLFSFLLLYLVFQLVNFVVTVGSEDITYSIVVFLSFCMCFYAYMLADSFSEHHLYLFIRKMLSYTILLLCLVDMASIVVMKKSQHVILSNVMPLLLLSAILLYEKKRDAKVFLPFIFFLVWVALSVNFFTTDKRYQIKALVVCAFICIAFLVYQLPYRFFKYKCLYKTSSYIYGPLLILYLVGITLTTIYLMNNSLEGRETSLGLRVLVAEKQFSDFYSGAILNQIFGYGLGSSMKLYPVLYGAYDTELRSHSGLISLLYEHGFIPFVVIVFWVTRMIFEPIGKKKWSHNFYPANSYQLVLFLFVCSWLLLNLFYLIAVPVPNFGHQSQLVLSVFILVYARKKAFRLYG